MNDKLQQYCATDKEIYDLLMSGKQKLTESVLFELARDRGIFYSPKATRSDLVEAISSLPHDYLDVIGIIERRDHAKRGEKTTSVTLPVDLTMDEIKSVALAYQAEAKTSEKVRAQQKGADGYSLNIEYDEYDYSRTRLIQRQRKEAGIEFVKKAGATVIRMPATDKARLVVDSLVRKVEEIRKAEVPAQQITLQGLDSPDDRTSFFTSLISGIKGYDLDTVINLKVASGGGDSDEGGDLDEDEDEDIKQEMLAVVHSVSMQGSNLVASTQYQQLKQGGFYITSITWRAKESASPYDMIQFDASFENGVDGTGFKYGVKRSARLKSGDYAKHFRPVEEGDRAELFELLESAARSVLAKLHAKAAGESGVDAPGDAA
ncbi:MULTISPECIES: hypothetical protein [unclassified Lysobacter]|uniref:hypothetical protein n=1 Tax=unclassified Lysobacter TaxID=2635362 RepID=UPI001BE80063|nr:MULTISPECIES: hypothetical protein [unclassified Lysobacter]MBT2746218.1 hypothetical protein [Lysobacter sp. ISL-42]MBT2750763.1 hypothetical protein [Lysobacter sp. ISL-50]MBT2776090.1 hypothetical protein [Lysobacter sp. ISL-54]MBT2784596.1 hypothetical protein [Lysobacter sp. ISL-52]